MNELLVQINEDQAISVGQAAAFLGYTKSTLNRWRMAGIGPEYVKVSRTSIRYRLKDLKAWLEANLVSNAKVG